MRTEYQAVRHAKKYSKQYPEKTLYVIYTNDDYYGPFAVADDYDLDGFFCGTQDKDIIWAIRNGVVEK